jgi:hypothetical protein
MPEIHGLLARRIHLVFATAAFVHNTVNFFPVPPCALLDAADQLVLLALGELQFVIRKLREFLFQFAFGDVPVSFGCESAHGFCLVVCFRRTTRRDGILPASGVPTG